MPRLILNDVEQPLENVPDSWGELLRVLEQDAGAAGHVVTAVRFDGVDAPSFREDPAAGRSLHSLELVEVQTASMPALIDDALANGTSAATQLAAAVLEIGRSFRGPDVERANRRLAELGEGIRSMISMLAVASDRLNVELGSLQWNGRPVPEQLTEFVRQLESLAQAQTARDWLTVADLLEYEFEPVLATWGAVFEDLRSRVPAWAGANR